MKSFFADIADLAFIDRVTFSRNFENNWYKNLNFRQLVKIILINEYSCLQMYPNERSFLTYWFLRIKWLFNKYVKITKERAIHKHRFWQSHKNRFSQSFKKNPVYSLVTETILKKNMIERIYWVISFQANVKRDSTESLEGHEKF